MSVFFSEKYIKIPAFENNLKAGREGLSAEFFAYFFIC
jgi:hypothetical protein